MSLAKRARSKRHPVVTVSRAALSDAHFAVRAALRSLATGSRAPRMTIVGPAAGLGRCTN
jgi:hypothetical protein